jgi:hypothetical protein
MANYDVDIWGEWRAEEHPAFYNFLRSVLRPPMLLEFDSPGSMAGQNRQAAAFVRKLREDILRSDLSETGMLRKVIAPAPGMNFADTVRELESLRRQDIAAFAKAEVVGNDLMSEVEKFVDTPTQSYLRGGDPNLPDETREVLDNFLADPFDIANVNALKNVGDERDSDVSADYKFKQVINSWNDLTDLRGVYGRADAGAAAEQTFRDRNPDYEPSQQTDTPASTVSDQRTDFEPTKLQNYLTSGQLAQLKNVLSPAAYKYLETGEYAQVATFGEPALSAGNRQLLDQFANDPSSVANQMGRVFNDNVDDFRAFEVVSNIVAEQQEREFAAEQERIDEESLPRGEKRPPNVPLPPNQIYQWDESFRLWKVIDLRTESNISAFPYSGARTVRYVNQRGETVDMGGTRVPGPGPGFGPERGETSPSVVERPTTGRPASGRPTTGRPAPGRPTGGPTREEELAFASAEFMQAPASTAPRRDPVPRPVRQFETGADVQAALASAEFGVPPAATAERTFVYDREPAPVPVDWRTAAQEMYPEYLAIVEDNPEIGLLLEKAIEEGYDETRFAAELRGTTWWKTTTATAREWDLASGLDPASYQRQVDEAAASIQQEALNLGIRLSSEKLQELALKSERLGWGAQRITNAIGMTAVEGGMEGTTQLREGYYGQQIRNLAKQYGVSLAGTTFNSFVNKIAVGEETLGSFQDYAMTIGKSLYPSLSEQFDSGRTFEDITSSYKNIAANILERDSNAIDMSSPEFVQAITYVPDTKTGEQRLMNMGEWGDYLRKTESLGYQNTTEARSRAYEVSNKIANMFGRV